jgi:hypothetical protein
MLLVVAPCQGVHLEDTVLNASVQYSKSHPDSGRSTHLKVVDGFPHCGGPLPWLEHVVMPPAISGYSHAGLLYGSHLI